jgi:MOSC domain-containing protein YiiM
MKHLGKVLSLFSTDKKTVSIQKKILINLDQKGIQDDKHYNKVPERAVLLTSILSYSILEKEDIHISHGLLGENILIDFNPYTLSIGSRLQIGETILEISQNCTLCNHLSSIHQKLPLLLKNDRGIFAKIIQEGTIKTDDFIFLLRSK